MCSRGPPNSRVMFEFGIEYGTSFISSHFCRARTGHIDVWVTQVGSGEFLRPALAKASGSSPPGPVQSCGAARGRKSLAVRQSAPDGRYVAFSVRQHRQTLLYVMQADGTNARIVADSLDLQGAPAWASEGQSIGCRRSRYPTPLPRADRWSIPHSLCP
jgi:hypothetical protein